MFGELSEGDTITSDGLKKYTLVDRDNDEVSYADNKLVHAEDETDVVYKSDLQLSVRWKRLH